MTGKTLEDFRQLVGVRPEIKSEVLEKAEYTHDGNTVFKIRYFVHPGYHEKYNDAGSAYIVVPKKGNGKVIFAAHQHGGTWKLGKEQVFCYGMPGSRTKEVDFTGTENQVYGKELADQGFIVIASDALCFGDRCYPDTLPLAYGFTPGKLHPEGDFWYDCNIERQVAEYETARGGNLASRLLYDDMGAITAAQEVLGEEIAELDVVGHSMGGQRAFLLAMLDSRVKIGVSNCGLLSVGKYQSMDSFTEDGKPEGRIFHNYALVIPGLVAKGLDYQESIKLMPEDTQFLMIYNNKDRIFPIEAVEPVVESAGSLMNVMVIKSSGVHDFPNDNRNMARSFLNNP